MFKRKYVNIGLITAIVITALILLSPIDYAKSTDAETQEIYKNIKLFTVILNEIEKKYVDEEDPKKLIYGAIKGMVNTLDPHSGFLTPEEYRELRIETRGEFSGIGIEITVKDGVLTVVSPIEGTPAFEKGLKAGDRIIKINGKLTKNMTLMDAVKQIRGPRGSDVSLTVLREGSDSLIDVSITRGVVKIRSVRHRIIDGTIGYARVSTFQEETADRLKDALQEFKQGTTKLDGIVLDLRNNPGGLLDQAVQVSNLFLESGLIVYTKGRIESQNMRFEADPDVAVDRNIPMIVLVNHGSASASEIVAGALQDQKRAVIVGLQTFGKGSVQTIIPLDEDAGLRLTTALYYTPNGTSIQAKGITPDIVVEEPTQQLVPTEGAAQNKKLNYLRERDLSRHLLNKDGGEMQDKQEKEPQPAEPAAPTAPEDETKGPEATPGQVANDVQLQRAVQLLKSWNIFSHTEESSPAVTNGAK